MEKKVWSEHLFLFPFSWKSIDNNHLIQKTAESIKNSKVWENLPNWKVVYANVEEDKEYNELVYFYKSVRPVLYTFEKAPIIVRNYQYTRLEENNEMLLGVEGRDYILRISHISLKIYKTGIGIMGIYIINDRYNLPEEILHINSFSKCIYPYELPIEKAKMDLFPDYVKMRLNKDELVEDYFDKNYKTLPISISNIIMRLLGYPFKLKLSNKTKASKKISFLVEPILGNQMFVLCLYQNEKIVKKINENTLSEDFLEKFILLNEQIKCQSQRSIRLATDIEYIKNKDTIYCTSRFSLIALSKKMFNIKIYDQLIHLLLMQRATLLSFSTELALVSALDKEELVLGIQSIYEIYIQFINQLYFKEVTEEIQGTQIYESLFRQLRIEEELKQLDFEMEEVHEYALLVEESQSQFKMNMITMTGAALVIPTFVTGFFGMNILQKDWYDWWNHKEVLLWMNAYVFLPMLIVIGIYSWNKEKSRKNKIIRMLIILITFISFIIICRSGTGI